MKLLFESILICLFLQSIIYAQTESTSYSNNANNITGDNTVSIGVNAGTTPNNSVFIGRNAGLSAQSDGNTFIGESAGRTIREDCRFNSFIGRISGANLFNSISNTGFGYGAGSSLINSNNNTLFGDTAGTQMRDSNDNTCIGSRSCEETGGNQNIAIGARAKRDGRGDNNIYIGYGSGQGSQGSKNIFIGDNSGGINNSLSETLIIENSSDPVPLIFGNFANDKVGINTTDLINTIGGQDISNYSLYVKGGLLSDEVRVRTTWADYVFDESYQLKSIPELANFIDQNGHLPNCPSEEEVLNQGLEIGDISRIQQEKIEELTLYIIQHNDLIDDLKKELKELYEYVHSDKE